MLSRELVKLLKLVKNPDLRELTMELFLGRIGKTDWEAALNDLVVTNVQEVMDTVGASYGYKLFGVS